MLALGRMTSYGKFANDSKHGTFERFFPTMGNRLGWVVMESPSSLCFAAFFAYGYVESGNSSAVPFVLFAIWQSHYVHRAFVFPCSLPSSTRRINVAVVLLGVIFNTMNSFVNAIFISSRAAYPDEWLLDARFVLGTIVFYVGYCINRHSDYTLLALRNSSSSSSTSTSKSSAVAVVASDDAKDVDDEEARGPAAAVSAAAGSQSHYKIPYGGMFRFVSCPNYTGEALVWCGWALLTWSLAGVSFAWFTITFLFPRARAQHQWYKATFPDYPKDRKAVVPFIM